MSNCLVTKLKAVVDNPDLPVLETIVVKNWLKTTVDGQSIKMPEAVTSIPFNKLYFEEEVVFPYVASDWGGFAKYSAFSTRGNQIKLWLTSSQLRIAHAAVETAFSSTSYRNTPLLIKSNTTTGVSSVNGEEQTNRNASMSGSNMTMGGLFGSWGNDGSENNSVAGGVKIKSLKFANTDDISTLLFDGVAAEVNGVACLYDRVSKTAFFDDKGGALICE